MTLREAAALKIIEENGGTDGAHHKQWVLDQVVRAILGDEYDAWIAKDGRHTGGEYEWDTGMVP